MSADHRKVWPPMPSYISGSESEDARRQGLYASTPRITIQPPTPPSSSDAERKKRINAEQSKRQHLRPSDARRQHSKKDTDEVKDKNKDKDKDDHHTRLVPCNVHHHRHGHHHSHFHFHGDRYLGRSGRSRHLLDVQEPGPHPNQQSHQRRSSQGVGPHAGVPESRSRPRLRQANTGYAAPSTTTAAIFAGASAALSPSGVPVGIEHDRILPPRPIIPQRGGQNGSQRRGRSMSRAADSFTDTNGESCTCSYPSSCSCSCSCSDSESDYDRRGRSRKKGSRRHRSLPPTSSSKSTAHYATRTRPRYYRSPPRRRSIKRSLVGFFFRLMFG